MVGAGGTEDTPSSAIDPSSLVSALVDAPSRPTSTDLGPLREYVARALLRPTLIPAPDEIHGVRVAGAMIHLGDPIDVRYAKYLQHAVRRDEWPAGTTVDEYMGSVVAVVTSDDSGVFADHRPEGWRVTFVGRSGTWEGLDGGPFIVVVYDCHQDRFVTAFQPSRGLPYVDRNDQVVNGTWLRRAR